ncbi:uncharacterized [Tachysurus ichikawai]
MTVMMMMIRTTTELLLQCREDCSLVFFMSPLIMQARGSVNDGEQRRGFAHSSQLITRRYAGAYFNPTPVQTIRSGRNRDDISTLVSIISRISKWRFLCRLGGIRHPEALLKQCCNFFSSY